MEHDSTSTPDTSFDTTHHHTHIDVHHLHHTQPHDSFNGIAHDSVHHSHTTSMDSYDSNNRREQKTIFSSESLQLFLATAGQLEASELTKAKELYIRNAISEYRAGQKTRKNSYLTMGLHLLIPIFWPMLFGSMREQKIELEAAKIRIQNALDVWKKDLGNTTYKELYDLLHAEM
jgi:hypothetical protein